MAPNPLPESIPSRSSDDPSLLAGQRLSHPQKDGDEVVISGLAGRFPDSDDVYQLRHNLYNKIDMVTEDDRRWNVEHPEIPNRTGKINFVGKFDASFFGVHFKQAHTMDPMCRILLEKAYEAVVDAGVNPRQLRGSRTGVFVGACFSESEKTWFYEKLQVNGFGITGCSRAMLANRVSYWLGATGPSYAVDSACSSSLYALEHAYRAIRDGHCDAALVGAANLCLHPLVSLQFSRLGVLSMDGACKAFDHRADGYARAEAACMIYLQKAKDAKRVYSTVVHAKTNCDGFKEQGISFPSGRLQETLLREFYEECNIEPNTVAYIEAHGTGTKVGDPEEANTLDKVFCEGREDPLFIGSVKSNLGHSEPASGLCSIAKCCLACESDMIPPNLHYESPRDGIPGLVDGRMQVVVENTPLPGDLIGVNSFGFGGANCHVLLRANNNGKVRNGVPLDELSRLVAVSGRTEEAVTTVLDDLEKRPLDAEFVKLFHEIHNDEISGHVYRGYVLLGKGDGVGPAVKISRDVQYYAGAKRPVWFVFSGMGSQWTSMGTQLMKIPIFAAAIEKCHKVLAPKGISITDVITSTDPKTFDNILNSFIGIAAIQIGLVDVLRATGIEPDNIIGHSVGELGCAYADGCFTAEQMILAAYSRGLASIETEFIFGSMAAVGIGYKQVRDLCPPEIEVACHNGPDSSTVSGPADKMKEFVASLQAKGIFAREVPCSNIAYHSRYIANAGPTLLKYLRQVITEPKARTERWLSSSVPQHMWNTESAKYSSAEYHTNNLLSPVLFEETSKLIPANAITIEIAPHGLLQAILRRSLKSETTNVALTQRGHKDNTEVLFTALGKLFQVGLNPTLANIYPEVKLPVSRGTPMISPLIRWEHTDDWFVTSYKLQEKVKSGERTLELDTNDFKSDVLAGHVIDGRHLYPATGYLFLVWQTVGLMRGEAQNEVPIIFENVRFLRATHLPKEGTISFTIMVQKGTGSFEVIESGGAVVTGRAYSPEDITLETVDLERPEIKTVENALPLNSEDIYKELRLRGYNYSDMFKCLVSVDPSATIGRAIWSNWVTFMDGMMQLQILRKDTRSLFVPTEIQRVIIDSKKHAECIQQLTEEDMSMEIQIHEDVGIIKSGGIEIRGLKASAISRKKTLSDPVLESYKFTPNYSSNVTKLADAVRNNVQIALENVPETKVHVAEVFNREGTVIADHVATALGDLPLIQGEVTLLAPPGAVDRESLAPGIIVEDRKLKTQSGCLLVVGKEMLKNAETLKEAQGVLRENGFIISRENKNFKPQNVPNVQIITSQLCDNEEILVMVRASAILRPLSVIEISDEADNFKWLQQLKEKIVTEDRIVLVSQGQNTSGILGLVNCARKEPGGEIVQCVFILDKNAPKFDHNLDFYKKQLNLNLAFNVLKNGEWGTFRHLLLDTDARVSSPHAFVNMKTRGDLSTLRWEQGPLYFKEPSTKDKELVQVYISSLNFRDIMVATGKLAVDIVAGGRFEQDCVQSFEYSGRLSNGRRVMGMVPHGALATMIMADKHLIWDVPDAWTLEDAATVPVAYSTAYYALCLSGKMAAGMDVLIHVGSGGVGQAAITLALFYKCNVYTTVGTQEKRDFIRQRFPQIPDDQIGNSRDTSFEQMIMTGTKGKGVQLVLNSLSEEKLQASVRCLSRGGRFLEIGKYDLANNNPLGMGTFLRETSFHGVMLDNLFKGSDADKKQLFNLVDAGIKCGAVRPFGRTVFGVDEIEKAYRFMASAKHIGKVVIRVRQEEPKKVIVPSICKIPAFPKFYCHPKSTYVICGGLGGFGLELADWLVLRGARNIVLTSRKGVTKGYQSFRIEIWRSYGAKVEIMTADCTTQKGCDQTLREASKLGPVAAIFNLAVILKDALLVNQTEAMYKEVFAPKAVSTKYLDISSRKLCPELKYFVVFSSVSCGRGNAGQTNYGMANSVMERVCESRVKDGLHGLAVQWGAVGDVGLVAERENVSDDLAIGGTLQQRIQSCLATLDVFLSSKDPVLSSMVVAEKRSLGAKGGTITEIVANVLDQATHIWKMDPDFCADRSSGDSHPVGNDFTIVSKDTFFVQTCKKSGSIFDICVAWSVLYKVNANNSLNTIRDLKTISPQSSLSELGMDSMMAVEVKQCLEREFDVFLTPQEVRSLTFARLQEFADQKEVIHGPNDAKLSNGETGIRFLVRTIGEEMIASQPVVRLPSLASPGKTVEDANPAIIILPGLEGVGSIMDPLSTQLNMQVLSMQYDYEYPCSTIQEIAQQLLPHIKSRLVQYPTFHIIAYSFGALVALELTALLEQEGRQGRLCIIDGSPEFLQTIVRMHVGTADDNKLQTDLLLAIADVTLPSEKVELEEILADAKSWEDKLNLFLQRVPPSVTHSKTYLKSMANAVYQRVKAIMTYEPIDMRLESPVTLIRPTEMSIADMENDYGLSKCTSQEVDVHYFQGNHMTILENAKCAEFINKFELESEDSTFKALLMGQSLLPNVKETRASHGK